MSKVSLSFVERFVVSFIGGHYIRHHINQDIFFLQNVHMNPKQSLHTTDIEPTSLKTMDSLVISPLFLNLLA